MATGTLPSSTSPAVLPSGSLPPGLPFALGFAALAVGVAAMAGLAPVGVSVAIVFAFAGPHNWFEARYVLSRLPARAGKLWPFFAVSVLGIVGLTAAFASLSQVARFDDSLIEPAIAVWNTTFLWWMATLIWMRSRTNPRFDGGWVWPAACFGTAGVWMSPFALSVALVYLHPLLALYFLDREIGKSRPTWRPMFRLALAVVPASIVGLYLTLGNSTESPGLDPVSLGIASQAGADHVDVVSPRFLIASHAFLETLHYAAWVVLIPLLGLKSAPWVLSDIPAARRNRRWARGVAVFLLLGLCIVLTLWACFAVDYATTRTVYFTVAMLHVLAEIPFLLRIS